jgi:hypothetical protein
MAHHGSEQVLNIVRIQPGLFGLFPTRGDKVLFTSGVEGRKIVLLLDLNDFSTVRRLWANNSTI